jgi:hypothetical protein
MSILLTQTSAHRHKACQKKKEKKPIFSFSINIDIQYKAGLRGYIAFSRQPLLQSQFNGLMKTKG